jgi:hypothetical protein
MEPAERAAAEQGILGAILVILSKLPDDVIEALQPVAAQPAAAQPTDEATLHRRNVDFEYAKFAHGWKPTNMFVK